MAGGETRDRSAAARPPVSKTAYVLERLQTEIATGTISPGTPLKQTDIAERYGVSPTPVREALRLLEARGAISYSPNRGATVAELDPQRIRDLYQLRAAVEGLATRLSVGQHDAEQLERILELHQRLQKGADDLPGTEMSRLNRELHFAIYAGHEGVITEHITMLWRMFTPEVTIWTHPRVAAALSEQHQGIIDAILAGDADDAAERMTRHILGAADFRLWIRNA